MSTTVAVSIGKHDSNLAATIGAIDGSGERTITQGGIRTRAGSLDTHNIGSQAFKVLISIGGRRYSYGITREKGGVLIVEVNLPGGLFATGSPCDVGGGAGDIAYHKVIHRQATRLLHNGHAGENSGGVIANRSLKCQLASASRQDNGFCI